MAKTSFRRPNTQELAAIRTEARKGSDAALPAADRRSRARISSRTQLAEGTVVHVGDDGAEYTVIGPGRGEGWVLLAWVEDGAPFYGTFHEGQIKPAQSRVDTPRADR